LYSFTKIKQILADEDQENMQKDKEMQLSKIEYHKKLKEYDSYIKKNYQPKTD
jgi:hypothetical protein